MDYSQEYKQKLVSADEAVKLIKSGDWVDYGWCTNTVDTLDKALAKRTDELKDINLRGGILLKPLAVFEREDAGEHFTCPICGKEAEVYSRITGYYRPVKNWNDGKRQEYKNRTVYDIIHSKSPEQKMKSYGAAEKLAEQAAGKEEPKAAAAADKIEEDGMYLFTTSTCPNCKMAKEMLAEEQYEVIDAERHPDLAAQYGIMQAPTLLVVEDGQAQKIVNASNIQKYVDEYLS